MRSPQHVSAATPPIAGAGQELHNFPTNQWWVAALREEVQPGRLLERRLLGKSVVLYRTTEGKAVALENRCPHRAAPLSLGTVVGDRVMCGYHGFQYGPDGRCAHIPTQSAIPSSAVVRSFPVRELGPLVWVWTGAPELAQHSEPPCPQWLLDDATWALIGEAMPLKANYMSLKENVLDLTHFGYVHASTFKITDWVNPPEVEVTDSSVKFIQRFENSVCPVMYLELSGLGPERRVNRYSWGVSLSPAIHEACMEMTVLETAPGERAEYRSRFAHITTPASSRETHYWWFTGNDYGQNNAQGQETLKELIRVAFREDKVMLECIQAAADADPDYLNYREVSVAADRPGLQARRILMRLVEQEKAQPGT